MDEIVCQLKLGWSRSARGVAHQRVLGVIAAELIPWVLGGRES